MCYSNLVPKEREQQADPTQPTHLSSKHYINHKPRFLCPRGVCDKKYPSKKDLDRHIRSYHRTWAAENPELANLTPVPPQRCEHCGYQTDRADNLKRHMDTYNGMCPERGV